MSPVRYRREGLRIVRVPTPSLPARPEARAAGPGRAEAPYPPEGAYPHTTGSDPVPSAREGSVLPGNGGGDDYRRRLHRFAEDMRGATARYRLAAGGIGGEHVREARRLARISQWELAPHLGIARSSIADAEGGRRKVHPALAAWTRRVLREGGGWEPPG